MLRTLLVVSCLGLSTSVASAAECDSLINKVNLELEKAELSETAKAKVEALRARGEEERKAGNKLSCVVALEEVLQLLGS